MLADAFLGWTKIHNSTPPQFPSCEQKIDFIFGLSSPFATFETGLGLGNSTLKVKNTFDMIIYKVNTPAEFCLGEITAPPVPSVR